MRAMVQGRGQTCSPGPHEGVEAIEAAQRQLRLNLRLWGVAGSSGEGTLRVVVRRLGLAI